ncbi:MAG: hypothetical protein ACPIOQ_23210 [Promethearchaeia archaeon]
MAPAGRTHTDRENRNASMLNLERWGEQHSGRGQKKEAAAEERAT